MPRRDSTASPFILSLLLHALVSALVVSGLLAPSSAARDAQIAEIFPKPKTVDVQLVDASDVPDVRPEEPTNLVSEHDSRAADRGPRDLPEGAAYSEGKSGAPSPTPGEGGRDDRPRSPAPAKPSPAPAEARAPSAQRPTPSAPAPGSPTAEAGRGSEPAAEGQVPAGAPGALADGGARSRTERLGPIGDSRLALPRPDLTLPPVSPPAGAAGTGRRGLPQVDNRLSRARVEGDFALSTYAWDYAPYMARLKRQIEDYTWTILPTAFWYGIAAWDTQVRFTILPDGRLESVTITGHDGVLELRHVAPDAVRGSADFEPLPPGFPDPKLTIVGNFYFNEFPPAGRQAGSRGRQAAGGGEGGAAAGVGGTAAPAAPSAGSPGSTEGTGAPGDT